MSARDDWLSARDIVRSWGWNVTAYQILNPGFSFWIDPRKDAVVGYVERHGVYVVGGAPVCPAERLNEVMAAFERHAQAHERGVLYFCAEERLAELAATDPHRITFPIGAQPLFLPAELLNVFADHASLRAQLHRTHNKGVEVVEADTMDATLRAQLDRCLVQWRAKRGLPALHFLIESNTLDNLEDRLLLVARRGGVALGFITVTPIPARNGWMIEQIVRGDDAPNGTAELLIHAATEALTERDAALVSFGLAPLAQRTAAAADQSPGWLRGLLSALRSHGRRFYNFEGLETFKAKFQPPYWAPVYASLGPNCTLPRGLLAIATAFSGTRLRWFIPQTLARAARREVAQLLHL